MNCKTKVALLHRDLVMARGAAFECRRLLRLYHDLAISVAKKVQQKLPLESETVNLLHDLEEPFGVVEQWAKQVGLPLEEVERRMALEEEIREKILKSGDAEYLLRLDAVFEEGVAIL